jgi:LmbE family N-acetylglucosaminyl deacetylase
MNRLLIISPHLDDGVLSCGARIAAETAQGSSVLVATCFTTPGDNAPTAIKDHYRQRKADDRKAIEELGADFLHLGFVDAPFRSLCYHNFHTILFHHQLPEKEKSLLLSLTSALKQLSAEWKPDEILLPLGVGGHIDHHLVWESSKFLVGGPYRITYYEELPYALLPGWSNVRCHELGGKAGPAQKAPGITHVKVDLERCPYPFVRNYLGSAEDALFSTSRYDMEYSGLSADEANAAEWFFEDRILMHNLLEFEEKYLREKCAAITRYSTEWQVLFGELAENIPAMLRNFSNTGRYTEISWRLKTNL